VVSGVHDAVADAVVFNSTPAAAGTRASVEVSYDGGARWVAAGTGFAYEDSPEPAAVHPTVGPLTGDTLVSVHGARFGAGPAVSCVFGDNGSNDDAPGLSRAFPVAGSASLLRCAAPPAAASGRVQVGVSANGQDSLPSTAAALAFRCAAPPATRPWCPRSAFHRPCGKCRPLSSEMCAYDTLSGSLGDVLKSKKRSRKWTAVLWRSLILGAAAPRSRGVARALRVVAAD